MQLFKNFLVLGLLISFNFLLMGQNFSYPFEVKKTGEGKNSIFFIPGFSCSGEVWDETLPLFETDYTCYTLTMAGFAEATPQTEISFKLWEDGIAKYIKDNKIKKPIIVGHSMGGGLAMAIAADYPTLPGKIVVVDALPCLAASMDPKFKSNENIDCSPFVKQMKEASDEMFYQMQEMNISQLMADTLHKKLVIGWALKSDRATLGQMFCDFYNTDQREKIEKVKCPALIMLESPFANMKNEIENQYKNMKTAQLVYANKGLHFIMFDDPEWYTTQLKDFVNRK